MAEWGLKRGKKILRQDERRAVCYHTSIRVPASSFANPILLSIFNEERSFKMPSAEIHVVFS